MELELTREERLELIARNATITSVSAEYNKLASQLRTQINAREEFWKRVQERLGVEAPIEQVNAHLDPITYDGPITFEPPKKEAKK